MAFVKLVQTGARGEDEIYVNSSRVTYVGSRRGHTGAVVCIDDYELEVTDHPSVVVGLLNEVK